MRYTLETPWARFGEDGSHFEIDYHKLASETGYTLDELRDLGVFHCYRDPRLDLAHLSEATAVLVTAVTRQAA